MPDRDPRRAGSGPEVRRRQFLARVLAGAAAAASGSGLLSTQRAASAKASKRQVGRTPADPAPADRARRDPPDSPAPCPPSAWTKRGVALEPTLPWEGSHIQNFTSPAEPLEGGRWRIWYSARGGTRRHTIAFAEGDLTAEATGETMRKVPVETSPGPPPDAPFAIGHLPDGWEPAQPIHVGLQDGRHRLYFWAHGPGILRYLAAESDDGRRYRVIDPLRPVLYHPNDRAARGIPTPDGVVLTKERSKDRPAEEPPAEPHLITNDAANLYHLPDGTFELFVVALVRVPREDPAYVAEDNAPGLVRVVDRFVSGDGLRFEGRRRVVDRDLSDPPDQQFYHLAVTHTPRGRVGMLGHYRCRAQTMDLEWCFSAYGSRWLRPHREAWLRRGEEGAPDSYGIYPGSRLVERNGLWYLFYTGTNEAHNGRRSHGEPRTVILAATAESIWG